MFNNKALGEVQWERPTDEPCVCGRSANPRHCPKCGSTNVYAARMYRSYVPAKVTPDGSLDIDINSEKPDVMAYGEGFKCKRCGNAFDDFTAFGNCVAPTPVQSKKAGLTRAERRVEDARDTYNTKYPGIAPLEGKARKDAVRDAMLCEMVLNQGGKLTPEQEERYNRFRGWTSTSTSTSTSTPEPKASGSMLDALRDDKFFSEG